MHIQIDKARRTIGLVEIHRFVSVDNEDNKKHRVLEVMHGYPFTRTKMEAVFQHYVKRRNVCWLVCIVACYVANEQRSP